MSYVLEEYKFGTAAYGTSGGTVTWSFATTNFAGEFFNYSSFLTGQFQAEVRAALDAWEAVANIDFVEVADSGDSDLRFGFVDGSPGGVVGQASIFYDA